MTPNPTSAPAPQEQRKIQIAAKMRALISPFFKTAVEDALATQDVAAFWEDVDAAIFHGINEYIKELAKEAKLAHVTNFLPNVAGTQTVQDRVAAWLREKAQ